MITKTKDINIDYLEYLRKDRGLTQTNVSEQLDKYDSYYGGKVSNNVRFTTQDLIKLIDIFKLDHSEILTLLGVDQ